MLYALWQRRFLLLSLAFVPLLLGTIPGLENDLLARLQLTTPFLPADTHLHYAMAAASAVLFVLLAYLIFRRQSAGILSTLAGGVFTGTAGIFLLLAFQKMAAQATHETWYGDAHWVLLHNVIKAIAYCYQAADNTALPFLIQLAAFTISVGLCEEITKQLPVLFTLSRDGLTEDQAMLRGFVSGIGFGVAEGIHYSEFMYNGRGSALIYAIRFLSCVAFHGITAALAASRVTRSSLDGSSGWIYFYRLVYALLPMMVLHGAYDTFCTRGDEWCATGCTLVLIILLAWRMERSMPARPARLSTASFGTNKRTLVPAARIDSLLGKIHQKGLASLTSGERRALKQATAFEQQKNRGALTRR